MLAIHYYYVLLNLKGIKPFLWALKVVGALSIVCVWPDGAVDPGYPLAHGIWENRKKSQEARQNQACPSALVPRLPRAGYLMSLHFHFLTRKRAMITLMLKG